MIRIALLLVMVFAVIEKHQMVFLFSSGALYLTVFYCTMKNNMQIIQNMWLASAHGVVFGIMAMTFFNLIKSNLGL